MFGISLAHLVIASIALGIGIATFVVITVNKYKEG